MSSYHCRFDDKDRTAASGFYDVADRLVTFFHVYKKDNSSECKTRLMFFDLILLNADQDSPIADNP